MNIKSLMSDKVKRSLYPILDLLSDKTVIRLQYFASLGRWPNIKDPKRYTEKLQWYKLNYRDPLMTQCADKYRMRDYIISKGFGDCLPKLYQAVKTYDEIDFDALPDSFAVKCNNGSGTNCFIKDKSKVDFEELKKEVNSWSKVSTISSGREWAYSNIDPMITVEELLTTDDPLQKNDLHDYKVLCFNGEPKYVWADVDRHVAHTRSFFDLNWNKLPVESDVPLIPYELPKPYGFEKMLEISRTVAKDFPHVRVDFYSINEKVYIGELTFYPWSGCVQYKPDSFDYELGDCFKLPEKLNEKGERK